MTFNAGDPGQLAFLNNINDAWTAYTPTLTNMTLGTGTKTSAYKQIGKTVYFRVHIVFGTGAAVSSGAFCSAPVASKAGVKQACSVTYGDTSAGVGFAGSGAVNGTTVSLFTSTGLVTATAPFSWAGTDEIIVTGSYEAA